MRSRAIIVVGLWCLLLGHHQQATEAKTLSAVVSMAEWGAPSAKDKLDGPNNMNYVEHAALTRGRGQTPVCADGRLPPACWPANSELVFAYDWAGSMTGDKMHGSGKKDVGVTWTNATSLKSSSWWLGFKMALLAQIKVYAQMDDFDKVDLIAITPPGPDDPVPCPFCDKTWYVITKLEQKWLLDLITEAKQQLLHRGVAAAQVEFRKMNMAEFKDAFPVAAEDLEKDLKLSGTKGVGIKNQKHANRLHGLINQAKGNLATGKHASG